MLNVGTAHVGEFGSREAIAVAKGELVQALRRPGVAVLNADDPRVPRHGGADHRAGAAVGIGPEAAVRATEVALDDLGRASFTAHDRPGHRRVTLPLHGEHHVGNALAVMATALECGLALPDVGRRPSTPPRPRGGGWRSPSARTA